MANKIPVKARFTGSDVTALGEFETDDVISPAFLDGSITNIYADSGAADAYVLTKAVTTPPIAAYDNGAVYSFVVTNDNTGASTANIDALGVKNIKRDDGTNPTAGQITGRVELIYDSGNDWLELRTFASAAFTGQVTSTAGDINLKTNTALSDAAATLTAAQLIGGEFTITPTVARIQTTDTATAIIAALSGSVDNSNFEFTVINLAAFDVTIALGVGVTLVGNMVVNDGSATFRARRLTSSTVSVTRLETGAAAPVLDTQLCQAWVNFDGTGTPAIRDSYNVATITDNGTGDYSANFAVNMANANYSLSGTAQENTGGGNMDRTVGPYREARSVSYIRVLTVSLAAAQQDVAIVNLTIFGGV